MELFSWKKVKWKAWDKSCENCAIKRGWKDTVMSQPYPFPCVHRETEEGRQLICAAWKHKLEEWKGESHG